MKSKAAFLISLLVLVGLVAFISTDGFESPVQRIQQLTDIAVPSDATDVMADFLKGFQDVSFYLQFSLPPASFSNFANQICDTAAEVLNAEHNVFAFNRRASSPTWWLTDPTTITVSSYCIVESSGVYLDIFVDQNNPDVYRIYMHGGTT